MPVSVKIAFAVLAVIFVFALVPMLRIWHGDVPTQRRLERVWSSTPGGAMGGRWPKTIAVRFAAAGFLLLAGASYVVFGGGTLGEVLIAIFGFLLLLTVLLTISILVFLRPQRAVPPHMRREEGEASHREPK